MPTSRAARIASLCVLLASVVACTPASRPEPPPAHRHLLILVDGLRPDYVTPEVMPNLTALGARGAVFTRHHSVYPTVTRVNASSISTGAYPQAHGLLGNSVFFPSVDPARFLDTGDRSQLLKVMAAEDRLLAATTLGESLQAAGHRMLVVSSGSSGSAFLNNHTVAGGAVLHATFTLPESLAEAMAAIGPPRRMALRNQTQSDKLVGMKTLSATDVARNFSAVLDTIERDQEEIVLVRNRRRVARLVPEAPDQDAMTVLGDLYRTLDDETADALAAAVASTRAGRRGRLRELRDPWAG